MGIVGGEYDILQGEYWVGIGHAEAGTDSWLVAWDRMYVSYEQDKSLDDTLLPANWIAGIQ